VALVAAKALNERLEAESEALRQSQALTAELQSKLSALQRTVDQLLAGGARRVATDEGN
jgi:hypothetical protein